MGTFGGESDAANISSTIALFRRRAMEDSFQIEHFIYLRGYLRARARGEDIVDFGMGNRINPPFISFLS